ncbi:hypothetical protein hbim_00520 [Mycolicibacterium mageritense]|uniref:Uncharacterized protein n=2 Tax=Mycolicibacterium mageritense TaxID=53462 RepID=A0AAI8XL84_MYCME|nr:hypothetical protein hbim_00520 [Mycolicibacterium mageritense]
MRVEVGIDVSPVRQPVLEDFPRDVTQRSGDLRHGAGALSVVPHFPYPRAGPERSS